jgi:hypothetical protein
MKPPFIAPSIVLSLVLLAMEGVFCFAQQGALRLQFQPTFNGQRVAFDSTTYQTTSGARITFSMLKFYVSGITIHGMDSSSISTSDHVLVDATEPHEVAIPGAPWGRGRAVSFTIGVDSLVNEQGPREGALDPRNGMYWTWATGYIFLKLEGTLEAPGVARRIYEIHVGGYKAPYQNTFSVTLPVEGRSWREPLIVDVALDRFFDAEPAFDITKRPSVTDARQASDVIDRLRGMFRVR